MKEKIDWRKLYRELNAIYPTYGRDGGNYTTILLSGERSMEYSKRTDTVVREICRAFGANRSTLRGYYGPKVGLTVEVPLPLAPDLVLVPLDMRAPLGKGHGAVGYIVLGQYQGCEVCDGSDGFFSRAVFRDSSSVPCCFHQTAVEKQILRARQVEVEYRKTHGLSSGVWTFADADNPEASKLPIINGKPPVMAIIGYAYYIESHRDG